MGKEESGLPGEVMNGIDVSHVNIAKEVILIARITSHIFNHCVLCSVEEKSIVVSF